MHEPPPMSPALRALVAADQQRPGPSDIDRRRVYAALGASLGVLPLGAVVAAHAASATSAASAATAASASSTAVTTAMGAVSAVGRLALLVKAPLVSVGVGAVLGATLTAYVVKGPAARWTASARSRRAAVTAVAPPRAMTPVAPVALAAEAPAAEAPAAEAPAAVDVPVPVAAPTHHVAAAAKAHLTDDHRAEAPVVNAGTLAAEQALLDPARAALAHGDGTGALARLALHERQFPKGALSQERDAMTIRALALTGDRARARARAESFRSRYPGSLLWPMIAATLDAPLGSR
jgi:hypothetical protein